MLRQGDLLIKKIEKLPNGFKKIDGNILAEGEATGHKHQLQGTVQLYSNGTETIFETEGTELTHPEHKTITIPKGIFRVVRQREYSPVGNRQVMD